MAPAPAAAVAHAAVSLNGTYVLSHNISQAPILLAPQAASSTALTDIVLALAVGSTIIMVLAPMKSSFQAAHNELKSQEISGLILPVMALFAQCYYWACYGLIIESADVAHFNGLGACLCMAYVMIICRASRVRAHAKPLLMFTTATLLGLSCCIAGSPITSANKAQLCAVLASMFAFIQSCSPLYQAMEMFQNRSPVGFPFTVAWSTLVSSLLWAQYSVLVNDRFYFISNALNAFASAVSIFAGFAAQICYTRRSGQIGSFDDKKPLMPRVTWMQTSLYSNTAGVYGSCEGTRHQKCDLIMQPNANSRSSFSWPAEQQETITESASGCLQVKDELDLEAFEAEEPKFLNTIRKEMTTYGFGSSLDCIL